jgi:catechol 2,3-dioxygenase-like lactoylglutathione lyase family enzyme
MIPNARYSHTNIIARDWRKLASFYNAIFGMEVVPPERNYSGPTLEAGTGVKGATLAGVHMRLPGLGANGPTLEIYSYSVEAPSEAPKINRPGLAHLAFEVPSVADALAQVLANGGKEIGEIVTLTTAAGTKVTFCYLTDPEGNILELQSWA